MIINWFSGIKRDFNLKKHRFVSMLFLNMSRIFKAAKMCLKIGNKLIPAFQSAKKTGRKRVFSLSFFFKKCLKLL